MTTRQIHSGIGEADVSEEARQRVRWLGRHAVGPAILDLGSGDGLMAILLGREGHRVLGVDIDAEVVETARGYLANEAPSVRERVRFEVADLIAEGPHKEPREGDEGDSGGYDTVILGHVLEEFLQPSPVLTLATELLAPRGKLLVLVNFAAAAPSNRPRHGFLVSELVPLLSRHIEVESIDLIADSLLVAGRRRQEGEDRTDDDGRWSKTMLRWLEREEREMANRLRTSHRAVESLRSDLAQARQAQRRLQTRTEPAGAGRVDEIDGWEEEVEALQTKLDEVSEARDVLKAGYAKLLDRSERMERRIDALGRELSRSVSQSAIRFKVGTAIFEATRSWRAALALPVTLYRLLSLHRKRLACRSREPERLGHKPAKPGDLRTAEAEETALRGQLDVEPLERLEDVVVFLAINGGGLGHLTRCLAVARKLERRSPSTRIGFFTTSSALRTIENFGFEAYYFPPKVFRPDQTVVEWNAYFARSLEDLLAVYHPSVLVFDGVAPYWAIVDVLERHPEINAAWISRGNWKDPEDRLEHLDRYQHLFDVLVLPGEALAEPQPLDVPYTERVLQVPPILLLDRWDLLPRAEAARELGLPRDGANVLIQLGAGNINDLKGPVERAVQGIRAVHPEARLVVAESLIAKDRQVVPEGVSVIKAYPLSRYLRAFDLLVSASGYNSFSEAVAFGVPTIFLPNTTAITDDQVSRAERAERAEIAEVINPFDDEGFERAVRRLTAPGAAEEIAKTSRRLVKTGGSDRAAEAVAGLLPQRFRTAAALVRLAESSRRHASRGAEPIRVATVLDEFSFRCLAPEARMKNLHAKRWAEEIDELDPQLLLVESTWRGEEGSWTQRLQSHVDDRTIHNLVAACRQRGVPTAFWNKDDPPHFETFLDAAKQFDVVFTTASSCVPRYREALGHDRVHVLPFAAQPRIHNPIGSRRKTSAVGFAGSWHVQYPDRQKQMEYILQPAFDRGLTIFDRMHGQNKVSRLFPPVYRPYIRGALSYSRLIEEYKHFEVFLNVNSVTDDPTMCARRVFEILASGTPVVSSHAKAIENLLGGLVALSSNRHETARYLDELLDSEERSERLEHLGAREILRHHTYRTRFMEILDRVGIEPPAGGRPASEGVAVVLVALGPGWAPVHRAGLERQEHVPDEIVVLAVGDAAQDAWRKEISALPDSLADRITLVAIESETEATEAALRATEAPRWSLWTDGHAYGRHYLADLLLAAGYSFAQVVGKSVYHELVFGSLERRGNDRNASELEYGGDVLLAASLIDRDVVRRSSLRMSDLRTATTADRGLGTGELFLYAADRFSYLRVDEDRPSADVIARALDRVEIDERMRWPSGQPSRERS